MSPVIHSCVLCGWHILDWNREITWKDQFRGLYNGPEGVVLTGIGAYTEFDLGRFIAPQDPKARWDDPNYNSPDEDEFGVMRFFEVNGRHGVLFHADCWRLLEEAFHPDAVPVSRLFEVCDSLPYSTGTAINWGHTYGDLIHKEEQYRFPWENRFAERNCRELERMLEASPVDGSEVEQILSQTAEDVGLVQERCSVSTRREERGSDCFDKLPEELRIVISIHLPTADVLNARRASRAFWPVFDSKQFWASRFSASSPERSWLFELRGPVKSRDWRWLYRRTNDNRIGLSLRNRKRIWPLAHIIYQIACCTQFSDESLLLLPALQPVAGGSSSPWIEAGGRIWHRKGNEAYRLFKEGCRVFRKQQLCLLTKQVSELSVYCVAAGDGEYIAGLAIMTLEGECFRLGFQTGKKRSLELSDDISGLILAIGSRGIQGIQCVAESGRRCRWLGNPSMAPKTMRLCPLGGISALEAGFDGFKMTSLSVLPRDHLPDKPSQVTNQTLRTPGVWFPDIPDESLSLNEESFPHQEDYLAGYKPLFWCHFGGPRGSHLPHLVRISVTGIQFIDFFYTEESNIPTQTLGAMRSDDPDDVVHFVIDGPGGEVIIAVETCYRYLTYEEAGAKAGKEKILVSFKVTTNRERSCFFVLDDDSEPGHQFFPQRVATAPGTSITGFYAVQRPNFGAGFLALGIISENIQDSQQS